MKKEQKIQTVRFIEQRLKLDNYEKAALKDLKKYYTLAAKQTLKDINKAVNSSSSYRKSRLESLYRQIDVMINSLAKTIAKPVANVVGKAGTFSYKDTNAILSWDGKVKGYDNVNRSSTQIAAMVTKESLGDTGKNLEAWLFSAIMEEHKGLKADIAAAQIRGVGYKKLIRELDDGYKKMFKAKTAKDNLETVTKSYIQATNAFAHKEIYEANSEVISGVEWSAIMENGNTATGRGTCPRCSALDGQEYKTIPDGPPCPLHPRCRCMYLPIPTPWDELFPGMGLDKLDAMEEEYEKWYIRSPGRKILQKGTIDGDYADWWATRSVAFQDNAIGPVRANLVRNKVLPFNRIVISNKTQIADAQRAAALTQRANNKKLKDAPDYKLGSLIRLQDLARMTSTKVTIKSLKLDKQ